MNEQEILKEIDRSIGMEADALRKLCELPDREGILLTVQAIRECKGKIILSGCGTSAMAAKKIVHSLNCVERPALFLTPSDAVHGGLGAVQKDIYMQIKVEREPCRFNMLATASTLAVISMFDAICITIMQLTGYTKEQFAVIHPGGAVGERLLGKAEDVI